MTIWELFSLKDRVAIVTGGAGKLGSQMCDALAEAGAHVVVASRNLENCQRKAAELSASFAEALAVRVDVTVPEQVQAMKQSVMDKFRRVDVLVNNAYSGVMAPFETMTAEQFDAAWRGATTSAFLCSQAVAPVMIEQKKGVIVNIASFWGVIAPDFRVYGNTGLSSPPNYGAAKAGMIQFTRWLATYLAPHGIRANSIAPGGFYSQALESRPDYVDVFVPAYNYLTPLGRMGNDTDLKGAIVYLSSDASAWMTGQNLVIDGGRTAW
jgi:gluconate 5-dehydrogenase